MTNTSLFWAYAVCWVLIVGYVLSISARQKSLQREIKALKAMLEQKNQPAGGR